MPNSCGGTYINRMTKNQNVTVPHLTTALTGPLENLEREYVIIKQKLNHGLETLGER